MFRAAILISLCYCAAITDASRQGLLQPDYDSVQPLTQELTDTLKTVTELSQRFNWKDEEPKAFWLLESGLMELMRKTRQLHLSRVIEVLPRAEYIFEVNTGTYPNPGSVPAVRLIATNPMEGVLDSVSRLVRSVPNEYWSKWRLSFDRGILQLETPEGETVIIVFLQRSLDLLLKHDGRFTEGHWDARVLVSSEMSRDSRDPRVLKVHFKESSIPETVGKTFTAICRKCGTSYAVFAEVYNALQVAGNRKYLFSFKPRATISWWIHSVVQRPIQTETLNSLKQAALEVAVKKLSDLAYIWLHPFHQQTNLKGFFGIFYPIKRIYFNCAQENGIIFSEDYDNDRNIIHREYLFGWSRAKLPTLLCKNFFVDPKDIHLLYHPRPEEYTLELEDDKKPLIRLLWFKKKTET